MNLKDSRPSKPSEIRLFLLRPSQRSTNQSVNRQNKIYSLGGKGNQFFPISRQSDIDLKCNPNCCKPKRNINSVIGSQLFKDARKIDTGNRHQTFLPHYSKLKTDNMTKIKQVKTAYSKLKGKAREALTERESKLKSKMASGKTQAQQPELNQQHNHQPSSLSKLIFNECKLQINEKQPKNEQINSSLHYYLQEQAKCSQWMNILCECSSISIIKSNKFSFSDCKDNPYELIVSKNKQERFDSSLLRV